MEKGVTGKRGGSRLPSVWRSVLLGARATVSAKAAVGNLLSIAGIESRRSYPSFLASSLGSKVSLYCPSRLSFFVPPTLALDLSIYLSHSVARSLRLPIALISLSPSLPHRCNFENIPRAQARANGAAPRRRIRRRCLTVHLAAIASACVCACEKERREPAVRREHT